jgi:hypothetical protein
MTSFEGLGIPFASGRLDRKSRFSGSSTRPANPIARTVVGIVAAVNGDFVSVIDQRHSLVTNIINANDRRMGKAVAPKARRSHRSVSEAPDQIDQQIP